MTRPLAESSDPHHIARVRQRVTRLERRPQRGGTYHIKLCSDTSTVTATYPPQLYWTVPADVEGTRLVGAMAAVSEDSTDGAIEVILTLYDKSDSWADHGMLSDPLTIDEGDFDSYDSAVQPTIETAVPALGRGDKVGIFIDSSGEGAKGIEVALTFA